MQKMNTFQKTLILFVMIAILMACGQSENAAPAS